MKSDALSQERPPIASRADFRRRFSMGLFKKTTRKADAGSANADGLHFILDTLGRRLLMAFSIDAFFALNARKARELSAIIDACSLMRQHADGRRRRCFASFTLTCAVPFGLMMAKLKRIISC